MTQTVVISTHISGSLAYGIGINRLHLVTLAIRVGLHGFNSAHRVFRPVKYALIAVLRFNNLKPCLITYHLQSISIMPDPHTIIRDSI